MGFRPLPRADNIESTLIWYKHGENDDVKHWVESLNDFIKSKFGFIIMKNMPKIFFVLLCILYMTGIYRNPLTPHSL